jgi:hypothetical protein
MAYDADDPRSQLATAPRAAHQGTGVNVAPQYFEFDRMEPTETTAAGTRTWLTRSQAVVTAFDRAVAGDRLARADQIDEYVVLVTEDGAEVSIEAEGHERATATGPALVIVPPGSSAVTAAVDTTLVRLFSTRSEDLCQRCDNAGFYAEPDPNVAPFQAWPDPPDGLRIRVYPLDEVPDEPGRFGRIFRSTTFMVNWFHPVEGPRDPTRMSPHHHDDFEQLSLQLGGDYVHHIRTPWGVDSTGWRDDEHQFCTSPSVTVIPPPSVHTSEAVGDQVHQLIDIFAPPRFDFSARPGWVLNAEEYPVPEG